MRENGRLEDWENDRPSVSQLRRALEIENERRRTSTILKNTIALLVVIAAIVVLMYTLLSPSAADGNSIFKADSKGKSSVSLEIGELDDGEVLFYYNGSGDNAVNIDAAVDDPGKVDVVTPSKQDSTIEIPDEESPLANLVLDEKYMYLNAIEKAKRDKAVVAVIVIVIMVVVISGLTIGFRHKER